VVFFIKKELLFYRGAYINYPNIAAKLLSNQAYLFDWKDNFRL